MTRRRILMGVVGRPHGVRGLVRMVSYTADPADLVAYGPLSDESGRQFTLRWRGEGIAEIAEVREGRAALLADRNAAEALVNTRLYIERDRLPAPEPDEFYFSDLVGLAAFGPAGEALGEVAAVHDYGAGASLELARDPGAPLLVPFTRASVPEVDLAARRVIVVLPEEVAAPDGAEAGA